MLANKLWLSVFSFKLISISLQAKPKQKQTTDQQMSNQNIFQARVQLQGFHKLPVEIIKGDSMKAEPFQLPSFDFSRISQQPYSSTKQAFLDMASAPLINLEDLDESFSFNDNEPEILLSDSDEEDEQLIDIDDEELDAETAIDSTDMQNLSDNSLDEEGIEYMEDFEESTDRNSVMNSSHSMNNLNTTMSTASDNAPRRVFIDLPAAEMWVHSLTRRTNTE